LHCAERNGDKGGNKRLVFWMDRKKAISLHSVWDTFILPTRKGKQSIAEYGAKLNDAITDKQAKAWSKGTPADWAIESWRLAREFAYQDVPAYGDPPKLGTEYVERARPVVDEKIQRAGVRLAAALNMAFR
jgi:hypothetical protein